MRSLRRATKSSFARRPARASARSNGSLAERSPKPDVPDAVEPRASVAPLSATRYRVELTVSAEVKAKLDRAKDLMRHRNPSGDLEPILERALDLLVDKLEREVLAKASRPRRTKAEAETPRKRRGTAVPRSVRREVFARDGEQCTYTDAARGSRCPARTLLELDHVEPKALGGEDTAANLRVRCAGHNRLAAEQVFGRAHVAKKIADHGQAKCALVERTSAKTFETAASALRNMGFRAPEVRCAIATLERRLGPEDASLEAVVREGLRLLCVAGGARATWASPTRASPG
jgi:5-methylcytosine-specific restriction endonuclease McrA